MEAVTLIDCERLAPMPDEFQAQPECPGCSAPVTWVDPQFPYCGVCGANLYWPVPERI
jgi:hypothetical protein